jgi:hypothetical protein
MAFWQMATGRVDLKEAARLRRSLLAYCQRDTWAMVRLHQALRELTVKPMIRPPLSENA